MQFGMLWRTITKESFHIVGVVQHHKPAPVSVVAKPSRDELESVADIWIVEAWKSKVGRNSLVRFLKSDSAARVHPEYMSFRVVTLISVAVLDCYLRFPTRQVIQG
jgi:hypothetical protein